MYFSLFIDEFFALAAFRDLLAKSEKLNGF